MTATYKELSRLASDINVLVYATGLTIEEAAAKIESEMDGTQPSDLMESAIEVARRMRSKICLS